MAKKHPDSNGGSRISTPGVNRTGLATSQDADLMRDNAEIPIQGSPGEFLSFRSKLMRGAPPFGSMPRPTTLMGATKQALGAATGEQLDVLLDKLAERLAFERAGTRLYETLLLKHELSGGFAGGPERDELLHFRDEEAGHFRLLERALKDLDADPTAITPAADITAVVSMGVAQVINDARTALPECLEAILVAELVDNDAWTRLIELSDSLGYGDLSGQLQGCEREEQQHLVAVRRWVGAYTSAMAGAR